MYYNVRNKTMKRGHCINDDIILITILLEQYNDYHLVMVNFKRDL